MKYSLGAITATALLLAPQTVTAIFDCNKDQHVYNPKDGKFVVHYTALRDSNYPSKSNADAWVRICIPDGNGSWTSIAPLTTECGTGHPATFKKGQTKLRHDMVVTNGKGCSKSASDLKGAKIVYNGQTRSLEGSDANCGPRNHGITCEFTK